MPSAHKLQFGGLRRPCFSHMPSASCLGRNSMPLTASGMREYVKRSMIEDHDSDITSRFAQCRELAVSVVQKDARMGTPYKV